MSESLRVQILHVRLLFLHLQRALMDDLLAWILAPIVQLAIRLVV
jgi:hypothetical protein